MTEPSGAEEIYFAHWFSANHPELSEQQAKLVWAAAWEISQESAYFSLDNYRQAPGAGPLDRHTNDMLGYFETVRKERGWPGV